MHDEHVISALLSPQVSSMQARLVTKVDSIHDYNSGLQPLKSQGKVQPETKAAATAQPAAISDATATTATAATALRAVCQIQEVAGQRTDRCAQPPTTSAANKCCCHECHCCSCGITDCCRFELLQLSCSWAVQLSKAHFMMLDCPHLYCFTVALHFCHVSQALNLLLPPASALACG